MATQDHQVLEETLRAPVAIPSVSYCCAGQVQQCSHDHHRTFQHFRRVFLEVQDQASRHRAVIQVQHCFLVLTFGMVVEAILSHHSHVLHFPPVLGFSHSFLGQTLTLRDM